MCNKKGRAKTGTPSGRIILQHVGEHLKQHAAMVTQAFGDALQRIQVGNGLRILRIVVRVHIVNDSQTHLTVISVLDSVDSRAKNAL